MTQISIKAALLSVRPMYLATYSQLQKQQGITSTLKTVCPKMNPAALPPFLPLCFCSFKKISPPEECFWFRDIYAYSVNSYC